MSDVDNWLEAIGLGEYAATFAEHKVDREVLPDLTEQDLEGLGMPLGHRKKFLRAVAALAEDPPAPTTPARPAGAERRQLTVMFVDLVGSTALSGKLDPEDMGRVIRAYQDCCAEVVKRWDGHVAKYMGDGVVVYFGWPRAHEDDAERAVRAGLDVTGAVGRLTGGGGPLSARVGIATGVVMVGDLIGEGASQEEAVVGETPNLAARLEALAKPGSVVVDPRCRQLIGGLFEYTDLGGHDLKGFAEPIQAWRVLGESGAESRFEALHGQQLTGLVGREHEIGLLMDRWERAKEGEGQVVLLSGEPGIGKSRIVRALRERLADQPHMPLSHYCSPYHTNSSLYPVIGLLERAAGFARDDAADARLAKLEALLARSTEALDEVVPLAAALLEIETGERYPPLALSPQRQKQRTLEVLVDQVEGLAAEQPVLAIYEDVHWVDPTTLEVLGLLIERVQGLPILVLITFRPEFDPPWTGHAHVMQLSLSRLTRRHGQALVEKVTGGKALPDEVLDQIVAKTDGVPLFVEELTKTVLESGLLTDAGGHYALAGPVAPFAIPATLRDSLMARLDHMTSVSKELAQIGATIGREFSFELLAAIVKRPPSELEHGLQSLVEAGLIHRRGQGSEAVYQFKHALVRDAAYDSLLRARRERLHAQIAKLLEERFPERAQLEPELLAQHFAAGERPEPAIVYWRQAGLRGLSRSSHQEAVVCFENALDLLKQLPQERSTLEQAVDVRFELRGALIIFDPERVLAILKEAEALAGNLGDDLRKGWASQYIMVSHTLLGDYQHAVEAANRAVALAEAASDVGLRAVAHSNFGFIYLNHSDYVRAKPEIDKSLRLLQGKLVYERERFRMNLTPSVTSLARRAWIFAEFGEFSEAVKDGDEAVRIAEAVNHPASLMEAYTGLGLAYLRKGDPEKLIDILASLERFANIYREPTYFHVIAAFLGSAYAMCGRVADSLAVLEEAIEQSVSTKLMARYSMILLALGESYLLANRLGEASDCAARALRRSEERDERGNQAYVHRLLGALAEASDSVDEADARDHYRRSLTLAESLRTQPLKAHCHLGLARLFRKTGRVGSAREELAAAVDLYDSMAMPLGLSQAGTLAKQLET